MTEQKDIKIHISQLLPESFNAKAHIKSHTKAITEKAKGYPDRVSLAPDTTWETLSKAAYNPVDYTAPIVIEKEGIWADPQDISKVDHEFLSYEGEVKFDENGRPLNPIGPTGLVGRGLLGKWGANFAADPIVTRTNKDGFLEMITIRRGDTGEFAIPGGMVDRGEKVTDALKRELGEETSAELNFANATEVYKGYVDDPRNTDNAWMETDAFHLHLEDSSDIVLQGQDDAIDATWKIIDREFLENLYASHAFHVKKAVALWQEKTHAIVDPHGYVLVPFV